VRSNPASVSLSKLPRGPPSSSLSTNLRQVRKGAGMAGMHVPLRIKVAMQPAALKADAHRESARARPPEPRSGIPSRPRSVRPRTSRQAALAPVPPPPHNIGSARGVREYLPRRLFGITSGDQNTPPPPPALSRRDKSARRKSRRDQTLTLQTDRLLPIEEIDETGPCSPAVSQHAIPQLSRTLTRLSASGSMPHSTDHSASKSSKRKRQRQWRLCIKPALAIVAYLALVAWVVLCLYLILLHGLALSDNSQRRWAWAVACCVSLTHELLIQQVIVMLLKLLVNRRSIAPKSSKLAGRLHVATESAKGGALPAPPAPPPPVTMSTKPAPQFVRKSKLPRRGETPKLLPVSPQKEKNAFVKSL
jgi:hypothetical protein